MKQLTVLCSADLSDRVYATLIRAGVEGFIKIPHAVGHLPGAAAVHGRFPHWEAEVFLASVEPQTLDGVVGELREFIGSCEVTPCIRILVAPLEAVY